jgi:hypothetical protein
MDVHIEACLALLDYVPQRENVWIWHILRFRCSMVICLAAGSHPMVSTALSHLNPDMPVPPERGMFGFVLSNPWRVTTHPNPRSSRWFPETRAAPVSTST